MIYIYQLSISQGCRLYAIKARSVIREYTNYCKQNSLDSLMIVIIIDQKQTDSNKQELTISSIIFIATYCDIALSNFRSLVGLSNRQTKILVQKMYAIRYL